MHLFADIDTMQPDAFARYLAEDCTMRFGNAPPLHGREACREAWASFCELVDGVHHDVVRTWEIDDATIAETEVTYTRKDGRRAMVPVVTIYRPSGGELIEDYRVYLDLAPVFAQAT
jgi:SnoaL-like domain